MGAKLVLGRYDPLVSGKTEDMVISVGAHQGHYPLKLIVQQAMQKNRMEDASVDIVEIGVRVTQNTGTVISRMVEKARGRK